MKKEKFKHRVETGHIEVEQVIRFGLEAPPSDAEFLRDLAATEKRAEAEVMKSGEQPFPVSRWLAYAAIFAEAGYDGFYREARKSRGAFPFILAFCGENKNSPECWHFLEKLAEKRELLSKAQRKQLLSELNLVFSLRPVCEARPMELTCIERFIQDQILSQEHLEMAFYAARGFPSDRMQEILDAAPAQKSDMQRAKLMAIVEIKKHLRASPRGSD